MVREHLGRQGWVFRMAQGITVAVPSIRPRPSWGTLRAKGGYFKDVRLWPPDAVDPAGWLENFNSDRFDDADRQCALYLANAFMFFSEELLDQLVLAAIHRLSSSRRLWSAASWNGLLDGMGVSTVSATGNWGAGLPDRQYQLFQQGPVWLSGPEETGDRRTVVLIDDFVALDDVEAERSSELEKWVPYASEITVVYCPCFVTTAALAALHSRYEGLEVGAAHVLPHQYSAWDERTIAWPVPKLELGYKFLKKAYLHSGCTEPSDRHCDTGYLIAAASGLPSALLEILRVNDSDWTPLVVER